MINVTYENVAELLTPGMIVTIHDRRGRARTGRLYLEHRTNGDSEYDIGVPGIGWRLSKRGTYMAGVYSLDVEIHGRGEIPVGSLFTSSTLDPPSGNVIEVGDDSYLIEIYNGVVEVPFDKIHGTDSDAVTPV